MIFPKTTSCIINPRLCNFWKCFFNINSVNLFSNISNNQSVKHTKVSPAKSAFYQYSLEHRQMIQMAFKGSYSYNGNIDGIWGLGTQAAYNRLRKSEPQNVNGLSHAQVYANIINNVARQQNSYRNTNNAIGNYFMNRLIQQSLLFRQPAPPPSRSQTIGTNLGGGIINCNTTSQ